MKIIESVNNDIIKRFSKLSDKKYRDEEKLFVVDGKTNVYDSLKKCCSSEVEGIFASYEEAHALLNFFPHLEEKIYNCTLRVLSKLSNLTSDVEVVLVLKQRDYSKKINNRLCIYLDKVRDPANVGTIIRTAAATGFGLLLNNCCDLYNPKVIRGSMSGILQLDMQISDNFCLSEYKKEGYLVFGADMAGGSVFKIKDGEICNPIIIAIGNEAFGLSESTLLQCDGMVSLPMQSIDSLNAAVAASVLMYEFKYRVVKQEEDLLRNN